jgi:hypothetical protein
MVQVKLADPGKSEFACPYCNALLNVADWSHEDNDASLRAFLTKCPQCEYEFVMEVSVEVVTRKAVMAAVPPASPSPEPPPPKQVKEAYVNLWELIITIASSKYDLSRKEECEAIRSIVGPRFGTELSLEIKESGVWVVKVFDHQDSMTCITLTINPDGYLTVERCRTMDQSINEVRSVQF